MYACREDSIKIPYICLDPLAVALQSMDVNNTLSDERRDLPFPASKALPRDTNSETSRVERHFRSRHRDDAATDTRAYVHRKHPVRTTRKSSLCHTKAPISHTVRALHPGNGTLNLLLRESQSHSRKGEG